MAAKQASAPAPRTDIERRVLDAAGIAPGRVFHAATVIPDGSGLWCLAVLELAPDGRWRELRRGDPTGRSWAEIQLADEIHRQNLARGEAR